MCYAFSLFKCYCDDAIIVLILEVCLLVSRLFGSRSHELAITCWVIHREFANVQLFAIGLSNCSPPPYWNAILISFRIASYARGEYTIFHLLLNAFHIKLNTFLKNWTVENITDFLESTISLIVKVFSLRLEWYIFIVFYCAFYYYSCMFMFFLLKIFDDIATSFVNDPFMISHDSRLL